jgi:hypothetical protein
MRKEEMKQRAKHLIAETRKNSLSQKFSPNKETEPTIQPSSKIDMNPFDSSDENENENELGIEYIRQEIASLSNRQRELDEKGSRIEKDLRNLMRNNKSSDSQMQQVSPKLKKLEDKLLKEWFLLVNEKNALLHQQQELEIL